MKNKFTFECYLTDKEGNPVTDSYKDESGYSNESDCQYEAISQAKALFDFYKRRINIGGAVIYIQKNGREYKELRLTPTAGSLMVERGIHVGDSVRVKDSEEITKGSLVKYKDILEPSDETSRFVITQDKGDGRVEVKDITSLTSFGFSTYLRMKNEFVPVTDRDDINNCLELIKKGSKSLYLDVLDKLEDSVRVSDKRKDYYIKNDADIDEFLDNFEPYLISDDYGHYDEADWRGDVPEQITLTIGDTNNIYIEITVSVYNITEYGDFDFDIEEVYYGGEDDGDLELTDNDILREKIYDFISEEVVFDETH